MDMEIYFSGGKKVDASFRGFTVKTDQPKDYGGEELAPAPFELFLASIGTCAGFYVLAFCKKRSIPSDKIRLFLRTEEDKEKKKTTKIAIEILLPPEFPEKYRDALIRTASLCAVKKHIHEPPLFEITTKIEEKV